MFRSIKLNKVVVLQSLLTRDLLIMTKRRSNEQKDSNKMPKNHRTQNTKDNKKECPRKCPRDKLRQEIKFGVEYLPSPLKSPNDKKEYQVLR
ncbi:hypothetical protein R5R35_008503 [Gryllus longicercus]|uniref:Uncharacterized protein n=1 Tax=Gryllus longicercus TaxID=2509291 RepID=A0AAN9VE30_9ORTH